MISRRGFGGIVSVGVALALQDAVRAQGGQTLTLHTAGQGSAFLPYGQGLSRFLLSSTGLNVTVAESRGSIENVGKIKENPTALGTVFLGTAHEAVNGLAWANGVRHNKLRALAPMYETSFQVAVPSASSIRDVRSLAGKRVGTGPAGGPAEGYFKALAEVAGINATIVAGSPADLARALSGREIDALWQGAVVPIPSLVAVQRDDPGAVVFGLTDGEVDGMLRRFPFMARTEVAAGTYANQPAPIRSISAWNFVVAHADLAEDIAYRITRAMISAAAPERDIHAFARGVRPQDATANRVLPFHPGAIRALREANVSP
jgi:hypothetical protein